MTSQGRQNTSIRSGLFIRKGLDLDKNEINALELEPSLLQLCKIGTTRYLLYVNKEKCEQCPTCGHWHSKEYDCHFCQKSEQKLLTSTLFQYTIVNVINSKCN